MTTKTRASILTLAAALGCLFIAGDRGNAGEEEMLKKQVQAIADALKLAKGNMATNLATALAKQEKDDGVFNVMNLMKPRDKKGFGVGTAAGEINPDGIEFKVQTLGRDLISAAKLKKESAALEEMAYRIAAIAHFAEALPPTKDKGKATKKTWHKLSIGMQEGATELVTAIRSGSPSELKKAASKVNANCNNCHSVFRN